MSSESSTFLLCMGMMCCWWWWNIEKGMMITDRQKTGLNSALAFFLRSCFWISTYRAVSFQANCWPFLLPGQKHSVDSSLKMVTSSRGSPLPPPPPPPLAWWAMMVGPWWLSVERETSEEWPRWLEVEEELEAVERWPDSGTFIVIGWSCWPVDSDIGTVWGTLVLRIVDCCCWMSASCGSGTRWKRFTPIGLMMIDCGLLEDWLLSVVGMASWTDSLFVPFSSTAEMPLLEVALEASVLVMAVWLLLLLLLASDGSAETRAIMQLERQLRRTRARVISSGQW